MTVLNQMQTTIQEEDQLPALAVQAFNNAFKQASSTAVVVYAKDQQLLKRSASGQIQVLQDLSSAYVVMSTSQRIFNRNNSVE